MNLKHYLLKGIVATIILISFAFNTNAQNYTINLSCTSLPNPVMAGSSFTVYYNVGSGFGAGSVYHVQWSSSSTMADANSSPVTTSIASSTSNYSMNVTIPTWVAGGNYYYRVVSTTGWPAAKSGICGPVRVNPIIDLGGICPSRTVTGNNNDAAYSNTYTSSRTNGQPSNDVWYKFQVGGNKPGTSKPYKITTCGSTIDTYIHLLDANMNLIQENDDMDKTTPSPISFWYFTTCDDYANRYSSMVNTATDNTGHFTNLSNSGGSTYLMQQNKVYYLVVEGYSGSQGAYTLNFDILDCSTFAPLAIDEVKENSAFNLQVYPNPFSNITTLKVNGAGDNVKVEITNINGAVVYKKEGHNTAESISLGDNLPAGVYFVRVNNDKESKVLKLVKVQ